MPLSTVQGAEPKGQVKEGSSCFSGECDRASNEPVRRMSATALRTRVKLL